MRAVPVLAAFALREALRRRVFAVVLLITAGFLVLYALGVREAFEEADIQGGVASAPEEQQVIVGATLVGLGMFAILFLGAVLAVFLTLGAVRADAERGVLQPVLVRPLPRHAVLLARFVGAAGVCALYVSLVFAAVVAIVAAAGDGYTPDAIARPMLGLAAGVAVLAALSVALSVPLSATANGVAVFMLFGAGLTAGLLGQIAEIIGSRTLGDVAEVTSWALPFEALYQTGLGALTSAQGGVVGFVVDLGPFGGAQDPTPWLWPYTVAYLAGVYGLAAWALARRDL